MFVPEILRSRGKQNLGYVRQVHRKFKKRKCNLLSTHFSLLNKMHLVMIFFIFIGWVECKSLRLCVMNKK